MKRTILCPLTLVALATLIHCAPDESLGDDVAAHTANAPVVLDSIYTWAEASYDELARTQPGWPTNALPDAHPLPMRLQKWADRVHDVIAAEMQAKGTPLLAPRPVIKVLESTYENAWVTGVTTCFPQPIEQNGGLLVAPSAVGCVKPRNWEGANAADYVAALNKVVGDCHLDAGAERWTASGVGCAQEYAGAEGVPATSQFIFYTTAILARQHDERTVAQVLVHELGHYYRGHVAVISDFRPFWYEQGERVTPERPAPVADSADLESFATSYGVATAIPAEVVRVPDQRVSSFLTLTLAGVVADLLPAMKAETPNGFACETALAYAEGRWRSAFYPGARPDADARAAYLRFERELLACADRVRIGDDFGENTLPAGKYSASLSPLRGATLGESVGSSNVALVRKEEELDRWRGALATRHVGRYTDEQEADDFSLEYGAKIGMDPTANITAVMDLIGAIYSKDPADWRAYNGNMDVETCRALQRNGWKRDKTDGTSEYVYVPLGDLLEPHHGDCYRMFNLTREQEAHAYRAADVALPVADDWEPLRRVAEDLTARAENAPPVAPVAPVDGRAALAAHRRPRRIVDGL